MNTTFNKYDHLVKLKKEVEEFVENGGNEALFWAGQLSIASRAVSYSTLANLSANIDWMDMVRDEYDEVIIRWANEKKEK